MELKFEIFSLSFLLFLINCICDAKRPEPTIPLPIDRNEELFPSYWRENAKRKLLEQLAKRENRNIAKNVIFFIGDGMSIPTITASRIYKGQLGRPQIKGYSGENSKLFFETFPHVGLSKTYCVDKQVADSACSATAYLCGVKANFATIGVSAKVILHECKGSMDERNHVSSIAAWAQNAGKGTGIVTTARVTHASPAGNYAHVAFRDYESDADVFEHYKSEKTENCQDIASQLIFNNPGKNLNVIMGGGRKKFLPKTERDSKGYNGERLDGVNLISKWKGRMKEMKVKHQYVENKTELESVNYEETEYLFGLFNSSNMAFHLDSDPNVEPSLSEMTEAAIKTLQKHKKGFYLFVEGGRIDMGHHINQARKALDETVEFDKAIELAANLTSREDTLIVVTADHSHVMTMSGYSDRGADILGLNTLKSDKDMKPYTTLSYANGPGYQHSHTGGRLNLTNAVFDKETNYPATVPLEDETHGGDDVGVFALGPWSHLFSGVYEQNEIPHFLAYASCIGNGLTTCNSPF